MSIQDDRWLGLQTDIVGGLASLYTGVLKVNNDHSLLQLQITIARPLDSLISHVVERVTSSGVQIALYTSDSRLNSMSRISRSECARCAGIGPFTSI